MAEEVNLTERNYQNIMAMRLRNMSWRKIANTFHKYHHTTLMKHYHTWLRLHGATETMDEDGNVTLEQFSLLRGSNMPEEASGEPREKSHWERFKNLLGL